MRPELVEAAGGILVLAGMVFGVIGLVLSVVAGMDRVLVMAGVMTAVGLMMALVGESGDGEAARG